MSENVPWRSPEGDTEWSVAEMDAIRSEIFNGTHPIAEINQKETLRCINQASMMFRDTLRDLDEGDACSEASDVPENSPKEERKAKGGRWPRTRIGPSSHLGHRSQPRNG